MKVIRRIIQNFLMLLLFVNCGQYKKSETLDLDGVAGNSSSMTTISGAVLSSAAFLSNGVVSGASAMMAQAIYPDGMVGGYSAVGADPCSSATYQMSYVGGGGATVASGSVVNNVFTSPLIQNGKEAIISFTCSDGSTQRCLAKAGDAGLLCNSVADGVVGALEATLGSVLTDSSYDGKTISKVGAAIVEASKNDSTAADALKKEITVCKVIADSATKKTCYKNALGASNFAGNIKMMQAMVQAWTVESILTMLVDGLGFNVMMDQMIYTDFGVSLDTWLSTDFVAQTRALIAKIINQDVSVKDSVVKLECNAYYNKGTSGGQMKYPPVILAGIPSCKNDAALEKYGVPAAKLGQIYTLIDNQDHSNQAQIGLSACTDMGGWGDPDYFCVRMPNLLMTSKYKELNRNDMGGKYYNDGDRQKEVELINVFAEVDTLLDAMAASTYNTVTYFNSHGSTLCLDFAGDMPVFDNTAECSTWSGSQMAPLRKYFSGVMGLYMYLKDSSLYETGGTAKLSLFDIHRIFTNSGNFLNSKLAMNAPGYNWASTNLNLHSPPVLAYTGGRYVMQDVFQWDNPDIVGDPAAYHTNVLAAIGLASIPYANSFQMFERIPTSSQIQSMVFGASHHEEWNPYGPKYFNIPGVQNTGYPIFCRMYENVNNKAVEKEMVFGDTETKIACLADPVGDPGVTQDGSDSTLFTFSSDFAYPYILMERGWMGDDKGRIYSLADRKTGMEVRVGEREVLILQEHAGNSDASIGACFSGADRNSIVSVKLNFGFGDQSREEAVNAFCMDMSPFTVSDGNIMFYYGGEIEVSESDGSGNFWTYNIVQVGVNDSTDPTNFFREPVCLYTSNLATGANNISTLGGDATTASGVITALGTGVFISTCGDSTPPAGTKYYLIQMDWPGQAVRSNLKAYIFDSNLNRPVNWQAYSAGAWQDDMWSVSIGAIEAALGANNNVAPAAAISYTQYVKMLNSKHDPKFDPYCDDVSGNGVCDCFYAGTSSLKNPNTCSLEDDAAEPTISEVPYCVQCPDSEKYINFFTLYGGKIGPELVEDAADPNKLGAGGDPLNGSYINTNQIWMPIEEVFQCAYRASGESSYRKPDWMNWDDFTAPQSGCPNIAGTMPAPQNTIAGGFVRLMDPKPMNNAYDIERPNTMIKLINFATKTVGQGVTLSPTAKVFSFDEALALIMLRMQMPPTDITVYKSDGVTPARDAFPYYESVNVDESSFSSPVSAVLRGLVVPSEL